MKTNLPTLYTRADSKFWYVNLYQDGIRKRINTFLPIREYNKEQALTVFCKEKKIKYEPVEYSLGWLRNTIMDYEDEGIRYSTVLQYYYNMRHLVDIFGDSFPVEEIQKRPHVQQIKEYLIAKHLKTPSINKVLRIYRSVFERLLDKDIIQVNPFRRFKPIREVRSGYAHFTKEQLKILFDTMRSSQRQDYVRFARILLYTGRRLSEILDLNRQDVDLNNKLFHPENIKHRDYRKQWIGIPESAIEDFKYFMDRGEEYPFRVGTRYGISEWFRLWRRKAGLPEGLRIHSLRHTFVTLSLEQGESAWKIKEYLDHSSILVTEGYAHTKSSSIPDIGIKIGEQ